MLHTDLLPVQSAGTVQVVARSCTGSVTGVEGSPPVWRSALCHTCCSSRCCRVWVRQHYAHLDHKFLLVHHLHAEAKEVAGLGIVVAGCIVPLQGVVVKQLLGIVLGRYGKVRGRVVDQRVRDALPISRVMPVPCTAKSALRNPALPLQALATAAASHSALTVQQPNMPCLASIPLVRVSATQVHCTGTVTML